MQGKSRLLSSDILGKSSKVDQTTNLYCSPQDFSFFRSNDFFVANDLVQKLGVSTQLLQRLSGLARKTMDQNKQLVNDGP